MIRHFFLNKTNTIIENSRQNTGLNPVLSLGYGAGIMRGLIHFDIQEIKKMIEDKTFAHTENLTFFLKMTNCFSVAGNSYDNIMNCLTNDGKRACSFDLILFKLPCEFDAGRGFDYVSDFWTRDGQSFSTEGSNWFQSRSLIPWVDYSSTYDAEKDKGGIYSMERIEKEYNSFINGEESIIVGSQHFDFGHENLSIDITKYVLDCIKTGYNYGLCLAFAPKYEQTLTEKMQCVNFFTDNTNTFFHPFVEAVYDEYILDRRNEINKRGNDKIYLYVFNDDVPCNLDKLPTCEVDGNKLSVEQATKGVYYVIISNENINLMEDAIYYDTWSEIVLNGEKQDDVEMEFYVAKTNKRINIGGNTSCINIKPSMYGINDGEELNRHEIREVGVDFVRSYTNENLVITNAKYRLYVKDGEREIDVIEYHPIEMSNNTNFFNIHTMDLIPNKYFIDIQITCGRETRTHKNVLRFKIVDDVTERYQ